MAKPVDPDVVALLEETDFSRHNLDGILTYHNKAESTRQVARLCFTTHYDTPEEAAVEELLFGFYFRAVIKGTPEYPTNGALARAFLSNRMPQPTLHLQRIRDKILFAMDFHVPAGEKGINSLEHGLDVIDTMLTSPLALTADEGPRIIEQVREEYIRGIEDGIQNHRKRAETLFYERYFPAIEPLEEESQLDILSGASLSDIVESYEAFLSHSFPVLLISGDLPVEEIAEPLLRFAEKYAGTGDESVLSPPEILQMPPVSEPHFEYGPSEQMHFIRLYPLAEVPDNSRDRLALAVVNHILGGGWTGHLMRVIREKHHLLYYIDSECQKFMNCINLQTEHDPALYGKISQLTQKIVKGIASGKFTDEEFEMVQDMLLEQTLIRFQGNLTTCDQPSFRIGNAHDMFIAKNTPLSLAETYKLLASLSPEDGRRAAKRYLKPKANQVFTYSKLGLPPKPNRKIRERREIPIQFEPLQMERLYDDDDKVIWG